MEEHVAARQASSSSSQAFFGGNFASDNPRRYSWLDGTQQGGGGLSNVPIRVTDLYNTTDDSSSKATQPFHRKRLVVPDDEEFNTVLGGGIMRGSLQFIGGEPGKYS